MKNQLKTALSWAEQSEQSEVAIATVISTWGSAPRPQGSMMVIKADGLFEGSVSGGCIEGEVIHAGLDVIKSGGRKVLEFGVSNDDAIKVGLACGGTIRVLVEKLDAKMVEQIKTIQQSLANNRSALWLRPLEGSGKTSVLFGADIKQAQENGDKNLFLHMLETPIKLQIIGAVHIAQALNHMAKLNGFDVEVIDPRGAFAEAERMQNCTVVERWPDEALEDNPPTNRTAIVTLTHDPKLDDAALKIALNSEAFYIGCLGSKKTHTKRLERLSTEGFTSEQLERIHGPVGLDIGAKSASEIAVSILAEIISCYRAKT